MKIAAIASKSEGAEVVSRDQQVIWHPNVMPELRGAGFSEHAICPWQGENANRRDDTVEARTVTEAVALLSLKEDVVADAHPERCARI